MSDSNWTNPMGGCDAEGNPLTVSFGIGSSNQGETLLGDGDRSEGVGWDGELAEGATHFSFHESNNHSHYGSGTVLTTT